MSTHICALHRAKGNTRKNTNGRSGRAVCGDGIRIIAGKHVVLAQLHVVLQVVTGDIAALGRVSVVRAINEHKSVLSRRIEDVGLGRRVVDRKLRSGLDVSNLLGRPKCSRLAIVRHGQHPLRVDPVGLDGLGDQVCAMELGDSLGHTIGHTLRGGGTALALGQGKARMACSRTGKDSGGGSEGGSGSSKDVHDGRSAEQQLIETVTRNERRGREKQ